MPRLLTLCLLSLTLLVSQATELNVYTYEFPIFGSVCDSCSAVVCASLKRIPGVIDVKIRKRLMGKLPVMIVSTTKPDLSTATLNYALGTAANAYRIGEPIRRQ